MAAEAAINIVVLGISGILSIPTLASFFAQPEPDKITVNIAVGATNSNIPNGNPGGDCPIATLYDVNGNPIGSASSTDIITDGGSIQLSIGGGEGSAASETPEYIQLVASGSNAVCIAWFSTTSSVSDGSDFRTWNGATAQFCGLPWYPSTALFPSVALTYQPPCFWMSDDGRFVDGFSTRLTDFFFPGSSGPANQTAVQWAEFPDTLCKAPARQQFYNNSGPCVPFYPSGLSVVNQKDPETGFDVDFEAIESSYTMSCSIAGIPFNDVNLGQPTSSISFDTSLTLPTGITLQSSLNLGPLARAAPATTALEGAPAITEAPRLPKSLKTKGAAARKEPVLNRRVENRAERPHEWCEENQLVISEFTGHSAVEVCESESSWGPDFVSVVERVFCDMCLRRTYPLCGGDGGDSSSGSATASSGQAAETATWFSVPYAPVSQGLNASSGSGGMIGTCFDLRNKQLRVPAKHRRNLSVPVKRYNGVRYWT